MTMPGQSNGVHEPRTESEAERTLTGRPLTLDYRPGYSGALAGLLDEDSGRFGGTWTHLRDVERMVTHDAVRQPYGYYKSGIADVDFKVKAGSDEQAEAAWNILTKCWEHHLDQMQLCYDYGWCGYEIDYETDRGRIEFGSLIDLHPFDCWALTVKGKYRGFRLKGTVGTLFDSAGGTSFAGAIDLWGAGRWPAKGLWLAHDRRWDRFYGRSQLCGAWRAYKRLASRDQAEDIVDGCIYRRGFMGPEVRYPEEDVKKKDSGELDYDSVRNDAMNMANNAKAGFSVALSNARDAKGEYKWSINWPPSGLENVGVLLDYEANLRKYISQGVGVPPELLEASETGSGYSGRKIPAAAFYESQRKNARNFARAIMTQIVNPVLRWNHGDDAWAEAEVDVRLPEILDDKAQGQGGAPPAPGGMPPGMPPEAGGQPPPPGPGQGGGEGGGGDLGALQALMPQGGAQMSLADDGDDGWLDPGWYPEDDPDSWSVPVEGYDLAAPAAPNRYIQRQVTRGPRKGQSGWYDSVGKKFMPQAWAPRQAAQPKTPPPAAARKPAAPKPPPGQRPKPATPPPAAAPRPQGRAAAVAARITPDKEAAYNRIVAAANKEAASPEGPMARLKGQFVEADFGAGKVRTVRSTKDSPLSKADHESMDRMHSRAAAVLKMAGEDGRSAAQMAAARYHRGAASKQPAPAATPAATPAAPPQQGQQPAAGAQLIARALNAPAAAAIPAEQKKQYMAAAKAVIGRMSPQALGRYNDGVGGRPPKFYESPEAITKGLMDKYEAMGKREWADKFRGKRIAGMYEPQPRSGGGQMHLDGQSGGSAGAFGSAGTAEETYAHEFSHAIDGPKLELSSSPEWAAAYEGELKSGGLTKYAVQDKQEAFAEFGRLLLSGKHDAAAVKAAFPKCHAFWASKGLADDVKADPSKPKPRLDEHFSEKVKIGEGGTHADAVPKAGGRALSFALSAAPEPAREPDSALDAVATPLRRLCREARASLLSALAGSARESAPAVTRAWLAGWQPRLGDAFAQAGLAGAIEGMRSLAGLLEPGGPPHAPEWPEDATAHDWPLVREAAARLASGGVIGLPAYLAAKGLTHASGVAAAQAQADEIQARVKAALARSLEGGGTLAGFRRDVASSLGGTALSPADAEQVFRTNVMAAYSDGQERLLAEPAVGDLFPFRAYHATRDGRVRPHHLEMETRGIGGTNLYLATDPVWALFRPPWGFSCRCSWDPVSVAEAARRGVKYAQDWQALGRRPSGPEPWVPMPPWRPDAAVVAGRGAELSAAGEGEEERLADAVMRLVDGYELSAPGWDEGPP